MASLVLIAMDMEHEARRTGVAERALSGGLRLHLTIVAGQRTLTLSRNTISPGADEISICRGFFRVPLDAWTRAEANTVQFRWTI